MIKQLVIIIIAVMSLSSYSQDAPKEVKEIIDRELPKILKTVFEGKKTDYNFSPEDRLDQITVSDPFRIRAIDPEDFQECLKKPSVKSIASYINTTDQSFTWHVIVNVNNIGKWIVDVRNANGKWRIDGYGGDNAAEDFNQLFKIYDQKDVVLFGNSPINQYYYHIKSKGERNLTSIDHQRISILSKTISKDEIENAFGKETDLTEIADRELSKMSAKNRRKK